MRAAALRIVRTVALVIGAAACGGGHGGEGVRGPGPGAGAGTGSARGSGSGTGSATDADTGSGSGTGGGADTGPGTDTGSGTGSAAPAAPVSPDECGQLVDHMIAIGLAEQHARDPRAPQATAEQQTAIRAHLLEQAGPACAAMSRASWQCAVAAADRAAMSACDPTP